MTQDFKEEIKQIRKETSRDERDLMTQHILHALLEATEGKTLYREQYDSVCEKIACYVLLALKENNEPNR